MFGKKKKLKNQEFIFDKFNDHIEKLRGDESKKYFDGGSLQDWAYKMLERDRQNMIEDKITEKIYFTKQKEIYDRQNNLGNDDPSGIVINAMKINKDILRFECRFCGAPFGNERTCKYCGSKI